MAYEQAPKLRSTGTKFRDINDVYPAAVKKNLGKAVRTHLLEQKIAEGCGSNFAAYKVMMFLTGNAEGFNVAEKTICERCAISDRSYSRARQYLKEKGWINTVDGVSITVNYDVIYGIMNKPPEIIKSKTVPRMEFEF